MRQILEFIDKSEIYKPYSFKNMSVFPVFTKVENTLNYITLEQALENDLIDILEKDIGGSVPELKVISKTDQNILLLDGEELIGAKQNRILNTTIIIPPYSECIIPVSCVEKGRWSYKSRKFTSGFISHSNLRKIKVKHISDSLKATNRYSSDQLGVWEEVSRKSFSLEAISDTDALFDVYEQKEFDLDDYINKFKYPYGCNGVIIGINGSIVCADIFDKPSTMENLWKKLIKSYALDAIEDIKEDELLSISHARKFLDEIKTAEFEPHKSIGMGDDVRIFTKNNIGSALVIGENLIHLALFKK